MTDTSHPRLSLDGMLDFIPKSRRPLAPVFEAISNALEAIAERHKTATAAQPGLIILRFYFTGLLDKERELERIEISDNGIGFDADNFERFRTFLDRSKGYNNRGSGRVQFLHFVEQIDVTSHYSADGKIFKRHFLCNPKTYITELTNEPAGPATSIDTTIAMGGFLHKDATKAYFDGLSVAELRSALKSQYLLRLHLARVANPDTAPIFRLEFYKNRKLFDSGTLSSKDVPIPETGEIKVPYVKIKNPKAEDIEWVPQIKHNASLQWAHFKLDESDLAENGVVLCSKNVAVQSLRFDGIKKNEVLDGHRYLTAVHGETLDKADHVSHAVDRFTLPNRTDTERGVRDGNLFFDPLQDILFFDDIEQAIEDVLPTIYTELYIRKQAQERDIETIAKAHGIPVDIAQATKIGISDSEAQITEKLFKKQAESLARQNLKIKKLFEALDTLNPMDDDYQVELERRSSELLELIPEQNKKELGRYIIRRQMVAKVLGLILDEKIVEAPASKKIKAGKKLRRGREALIHDLLIKRKSSTPSGPNDLWVLNEEFVHFEGCSNLRIDQIKDAKGNQLLRPIAKVDLEKYGIRPGVQPDIFLYADEAQCILIELKAPDVNMSEYLNQLPMYCNLIANFAVKPITRFYCYLIGETLSPIEIGGDYRQTVHGDFVRRADYSIMRYENGRQDEEIGKAQIEIVKLSSIHGRALRRNKSFADRLGISDDTLKAEQ